jgi:hypothetical protein
MRRRGNLERWRGGRAAIGGLAALGAALVLGGAGTLRAAPSEAQTVTALLTEVAASPKKSVADDAVRRARVALDRGAKLRAGGDEAHARLFDGVAREWAETAKDLVRTVTAEGEAAAAHREADDAGATAQRERALLEEAIAQNGRRRAQIDEIDRQAKEAPVRTSKVAGKITPGAPAQEAPDKMEPKSGRDGGVQ